jgi:gamma-glutamylcyclotransferase (GGCT)/AIG2-like uncharacterized protein YtfP
MPELPYLFVYGTLRRSAGTEWSKFLSANSRFVGAGRARGALLQLDGYPGMTVRTGDDAWVGGELHLLHDPSSTLPLLDAYEGCEFERQVVTVALDSSGQTVAAWAYIYSLENPEQSKDK